MRNVISASLGTQLFSHFKHWSALLLLLSICGVARETYAAASMDIPKSNLTTGGAYCTGTSGIAVGTSGICDMPHVLSDNTNARDVVTTMSITGDSEFTISSSSSCVIGADAPSSPGCSVAINFAPTSVGVKTATLHVSTSYNFVNPHQISNFSIPITGQGLAPVTSCSQKETPVCQRSDGTVVDSSLCSSATQPATSQSCTGGSCAACTTGLQASRFIELGRLCTGRSGCASFYPIFGVTDQLHNSCGVCTPRVVNDEPCPTPASATASCGGSYTVSNRECTYYDVDGTHSTTAFSSTKTIVANCIYTMANAGGATCSSCVASWILPGGGTNPVGTQTANTTCPFTPF